MSGRKKSTRDRTVIDPNKILKLLKPSEFKRLKIRIGPNKKLQAWDARVEEHADIKFLELEESRLVLHDPKELLSQGYSYHVVKLKEMK